MKLQYYPDGDILYVEFSNTLIEETRDITEQALGEFDNQDRLVAVTLSGVSQYIDVEALPAQLVEWREGEDVESSLDIKKAG